MLLLLVLSTLLTNQADDLSACPICNARMKVEDVFQHLDTHQEDKEMEEPKKGSSSSGRSVQSMVELDL